MAVNDLITFRLIFFTYYPTEISPLISTFLASNGIPLHSAEMWMEFIIKLKLNRIQKMTNTHPHLINIFILKATD